MRTTSNRRVSSMAIALVMVPFILAAVAAGKFMESRYGSVTVPLSTSVSFTVTNGADKVAIGSIMVRADAASNTWTIALVNNNYTNILKTGTLTASANTLVYEGYGTVPLGAGSRLVFTGTVNTNAALTTNIVQWSVFPMQAY